MQASERSRPQSSRPAESLAAKGMAVALPALVVLASFLGGTTQRWSEAIVAGCFALLLLARPPRYSLGKGFNLLALLFLALAAAAFLPARWFLLPDWRVALTNDFGLHLPPSVTPQPWLTFDSSLTFVAGLAWIYYVATFDASLRDIRLAARVFAGGMILLAGLCICLYFTHRAPPGSPPGTAALPFWHNPRGFGPYPNRNQTGDLFGVAAVVVLGCMQDDFRRGYKRWLFWLPGVAILTTALVLNFSRAGILILVAGAAAWLARLALRKASGASVAVAASVLLVLFSALLLFGGETIERFHLRLGSEGSVTSEYRWLIFRDALGMIKASPWCGLGLGNFESIFALFRNLSRGESRSLHPESDWLWLGSEMGWLAVAIVIAGVVLLVRRVFPLQDGSNQRLRYAALTGALLFTLHGFVDVSAHRFGTFLAGTFLFGLAQFRPSAASEGRWVPIFFRLLGIVLAAASVTWLLGAMGRITLPGYIGVAQSKEAAAFAAQGHRFREAISLCDRGLDSAPLDWQLYFLRARAEVGLRESSAEPLADFRRARFLEPSAYQLPFEEGKAWLGSDPALAITAWREALRRYGAQAEKLYSQMFPLAERYDPRVHQKLGQLAETPRLTIMWLENIGASQFAAAIQGVLARDPALAQFDRDSKRRLFALWSRRDPAAVATALATHPDWLEFAWPGVARYHAARAEFREAWSLVSRFAARPALPSAPDTAPLAELEQKLYTNTDDYAAGYALFLAQKRAGKVDDALATIRHFSAQPQAPAYFHYLEAECWAAKENWERAWESWDAYRSSGGAKPD